jgi:hypothetical protein
MAIGLAASLLIVLIGDGVSTSVTIDTDKVPDRYYESGSPHYGKLTKSGPACVSFQIPGQDGTGTCGTSSVTTGNKVTFTFPFPLPDGIPCYGNLSLVFTP